MTQEENVLKKLIFDCDSTVGIEQLPMDDALALLYVLGRPQQAQVLGITCTFGNGTAAQVYTSTQKLLEEIGRSDIPLFAGAGKGEDPCSDSARFIVETANRLPGEVTVLSIGSLTNLYGAFLLDHDIFNKLHAIVLMGGITAPLIYHRQHLDELNFSVNAAAAACVLQNGRNISIITGNNSLAPSYLPKEEFIDKMCTGANPSGRYIAEKCGYRFDDKEVRYGEAGSYCWDAVAAVYLLKPELFDAQPTRCRITEANMQTGWLDPVENLQEDNVRLLNLPQVRDIAVYQEEMYQGWLDFQLTERK